MRTMQVGNVEIVELSDGVFRPPAAAMFPETPEDAWAPYQAELFDDQKRLNLKFGAFLLRCAGTNVLVDTGLGAAAAQFGIPAGQLERELAETGVPPADISAVLITHMHPDHIGGCAREDGGAFVPAYPNARYHIDSADWAHFTADEKLRAGLGKTALPVERAGQLVLTSGEHAVNDELTLLPTPGHTPGHVSVLISSNGERSVILGDVSHSPVQVTEPGWPTAGDLDRLRGTASRSALFDRIEADGMRVAAGHYGAGSFGRFVRLEGVRRWQGIG